MNLHQYQARTSTITTWIPPSKSPPSLLPELEKDQAPLCPGSGWVSMIDAMVNDGDYVIMKPVNNNARSATAIWSLSGCRNQDETTLKYFYKEKDGYRLQPANPTMAPILVSKEEPLEIKGKVVHGDTQGWIRLQRNDRTASQSKDGLQKAVFFFHFNLTRGFCPPTGGLSRLDPGFPGSRTCKHLNPRLIKPGRLTVPTGLPGCRQIAPGPTGTSGSTPPGLYSPCMVVPVSARVTARLRLIPSRSVDGETYVKAYSLCNDWPYCWYRALNVWASVAKAY